MGFLWDWGLGPIPILNINYLIKNKKLIIKEIQNYIKKYNIL